MMSLFSSFDLNFFYLSVVIFCIMILNMGSYIFKTNIMGGFLAYLTLLLSLFLSSLKPKMYTTFSLTLLVGLIFSTFIFNFSSIFPFNFPLTSQVSVVLTVSLTFWLSFILSSVAQNFNGLMFHFVPEGTPLYLTWFLFFIEMVSNSIRPITLTVRLTANIMAGHLLMSLLCKLVLLTSVMFFPYMFLNLIELFVALIQSYIFMTMVSLYYSEVN